MIAGRRAGPARPRIPSAIRVERPLLRLLHAKPAMARSSSPNTARCRRSQRRQRDRDDAAHDPASDQHEPQRRHARIRTATATCTSASATAAPPTIPPNNAQNLECAAREDPADRRRSATAGTLFARRRTIRSSARRRPRRDLRLRAAQSVAFQLRPRRPARNGSPTSARARARKSTRRSSTAATTAGASTKARPAPSNDPRCATRRTTSFRSSTTRMRAAAARSPAATSIAAPRERCRPAPTSTATTAPARSSPGTAPRRRVLLDTPR